MPKGIIVKGIGGFYYVKTDAGIIECKARGRFRKEIITPKVGDWVQILLLQENRKGSIEKIIPRKTELTRPPVSNVDQLVIVAAISSPEPNLLLIDKLVIAGETKELDIILCINKLDLEPDQKKFNVLKNVYSSIGYQVIGASCHTGAGIEKLRTCLEGKITAFAGASGVGKSSLLNSINPGFTLQTGEVSRKIERGKHTTRHVELLEYKENGYVVDTPGFSSFELSAIPPADLQFLFREFEKFIPHCRFRGCTHTAEPECAVIEAVNEGNIFQERYNHYLQFYNQQKKFKEWDK